jgi:RNA polymerase sigma-70 factor (ECF subfamily)
VDPRLVERARDGDADAYAHLALDVSDRLYGVALRILRDADAAADALQAALVAIWRDLPALRDLDRFEAWSYRVLIRCCQADRRRAKRSIIALELMPHDAAAPDTQTSVALRDELAQAFRTLSDEQRAVLVLLYYRDLTLAEIAEALNISIGTVKSRLHYARQAMRAAVEAEARTTERQERPA